MTLALEPVLIPDQRTSDASQRRTLALLRAGVPLSLIFDLAVPEPHSADLYEWEAGQWL